MMPRLNDLRAGLSKMAVGYRRITKGSRSKQLRNLPAERYTIVRVAIRRRNC